MRHKQGRRVGTGTVLMALAVACAPVGSATSSASDSAPTSVSAATVVRHVSPVTSAGELRPAFSVVAQHTGATCLGGSVAIGHAYRCFAENSIYDPCWVQAGAGEHVVCLGRPWRQGVVRLAVTKGFSGQPMHGFARPWAARTGDGSRCLFAQGVSGEVSGHRINYICGDRLLLVGRVDRSSDVWRIRRAVPEGHGDFALDGWARLRTAWYGERSL